MVAAWASVGGFILTGGGGRTQTGVMEEERWTEKGRERENREEEGTFRLEDDGLRR